MASEKAERALTGTEALASPALKDLAEAPDTMTPAEMCTETIAIWLADRIADARKRKGLDQTDIARTVGVSQATVARMERPATLAQMPLGRVLDTLLALGLLPELHLKDLGQATPALEAVHRPGQPGGRLVALPSTSEEITAILKEEIAKAMVAPHSEPAAPQETENTETRSTVAGGGGGGGLGERFRFGSNAVHAPRDDRD
ncbi:MAG: helix-turn-helix domain-containing protein [Alphaproteobacteria bacterium]|nr:helix-turn-helix domain-containing protein [Alphaproteobacteria bacterium]